MNGHPKHNNTMNKRNVFSDRLHSLFQGHKEKSDELRPAPFENTSFIGKDHMRAQRNHLANASKGRRDFAPRPVLASRRVRSSLSRSSENLEAALNKVLCSIRGQSLSPARQRATTDEGSAASHAHPLRTLATDSWDAKCILRRSDSRCSQYRAELQRMVSSRRTCERMLAERQADRQLRRSTLDELAIIEGFGDGTSSLEDLSQEYGKFERALEEQAESAPNRKQDDDFNEDYDDDAVLTDELIVEFGARGA